MLPINQLAWQVYPLVMSQTRDRPPTLAAGLGGVVMGPAPWPPLDLAAVCDLVERMGLQPADWELLVRQLQAIHEAIGEARSGQPG